MKNGWRTVVLFKNGKQRAQKEKEVAIQLLSSRPTVWQIVFSLKPKIVIYVKKYSKLLKKRKIIERTEEAIFSQLNINCEKH